jgi:hypothetical protein
MESQSDCFDFNMEGTCSQVSSVLEGLTVHQRLLCKWHLVTDYLEEKERRSKEKFVNREAFL